MTTQFEVGTKFRFEPTGLTYIVTRVSEVSVWYMFYNFDGRTATWRVAKTTFAAMLQDGRHTIV